MPWPQTGATHYHAQLGLPDKGRLIKGLVVAIVCCCMAKIKWSMGWVYGSAQCAWSVPLLWSGWLSSSSTYRIDSSNIKHVDVISTITP